MTAAANLAWPLLTRLVADSAALQRVREAHDGCTAATCITIAAIEEDQ